MIKGAPATDGAPAKSGAAKLGPWMCLALVMDALPLSLARAGSFPRWFGVTNPAGTPVRALVGSSLLTTALVFMNSAPSMGDALVFLALLATSVTLFLYFGVAAAVLKLRVGGGIGILAAAA